MKAKELRELSDEELAVKLAETVKELTTMRIKHNSSGVGLEKPERMRGMRHDIARMKTIQTERKAKK